MILAHLPAGYLALKPFSSKFSSERAKSLWVCGLLASVLPDIDILYFYFVKLVLDGSPPSHRYFATHWPLFWLALFAIACGLLLVFKRKDLLSYPCIILAGVFLHLALDTISAPVFYAAPFSWERLQFVRVPAVYNWWVMNFLRHWTFLLELSICTIAILVHLTSYWLALRPRGRRMITHPSRRAG